MTGEPLTVDVRSPTTAAAAAASNGVLSLSSGRSSIGWDSRTPLIHNQSSPSLDNADRLVLPQPTSPSLSIDSLGGATDTTELDTSASPEAATPLSMPHCVCILSIMTVTDTHLTLSFPGQPDKVPPKRWRGAGA